MQFQVTGTEIDVRFELVASPSRDLRTTPLADAICRAARAIEAEPWAWALGTSAARVAPDAPRER